jgi:hypothetical protein
MSQLTVNVQHVGWLNDSEEKPVEQPKEWFTDDPVDRTVQPTKSAKPGANVSYTLLRLPLPGESSQIIRTTPPVETKKEAAPQSNKAKPKPRRKRERYDSEEEFGDGVEDALWSLHSRG